MIVRTNYAEYPASGERPELPHDDLMVVYVAAGGAVRADYYDSEGHVVRYSVRSPAVDGALFVSDVAAGEPRYRLSYKLEPSGVLKGDFAIAPPGQPEAFRPYLAWQASRLKNASK